MKTFVKTLPLFLIFLLSCSNNPEPIQYGTDACHFCKMNIVDKTHSAQAVSSKGKQFKYDAIECMINDINNNQNTDMAIILVANYLNAGEMLNAENAHYIISPNIPSPMGGNISATNSKAAVEKLLEEHSGDLFTWDALKNKNKKSSDQHSNH